MDVTNFAIDWAQVKKCSYKGEVTEEVLRKKARPSPALRSKIVAEIVRQVTAKVKDPTKKSLEVVHTQIITGPYKESFTETLGKGTNCTGGLLYKMKTKFDNDNRPDRNSHRRNDDALVRQFEKPRGKFSYGCIRWRVRDLEPDQTNLSMEQAKDKMKKIFSEVRAKFWDWDEINNLMKHTYKIQRDLINKNIEVALNEQKRKLVNSRKRKRSNRQMEEEVDDPNPNPNPAPERITINDIHSHFPLLFAYNGMLTHFKELTKVDLEAELAEFNTNGKEALVTLFRSQTDDPFYATVLKEMDKSLEREPEGDHKFRAILLMLPHYFGEKSFIEMLEVSYSQFNFACKILLLVHCCLKRNVSSLLLAFHPETSHETMHHKMKRNRCIKENLDTGEECEATK